MNLNETSAYISSCSTATRHRSVRYSTKSTTGLIATTHTGCRISEGPPRTFITCLSGAARLMMRSLGSNAKIKWTVAIRTHWSKYCLIPCFTNCMTVLTASLQTNTAAKKRKRFVLTVTVQRNETHIKKNLQKGCRLGYLPTKACTTMRIRCTNTLVKDVNHNRTRIRKTKLTKRILQKMTIKQISQTRKVNNSKKSTSLNLYK